MYRYIYCLFLFIYLVELLREKNVFYFLFCILKLLIELEMYVLFRKVLFEKGIVVIYYIILIFSFCIICIVYKIEVRYVCMSEELF